MRVGIDGRMLYHTGIGRYIQNLLTYLPREGVEIVAWLNAQGMKDERLSNPYLERRLCEVPVFHPYEHWAIAQEAHRAKIELLHAPHYNAPFFYSGRLIVTIHDLIPLRCPGTMRIKAGEAYFSWLVKHSVKRAERVIAVSNYTRSDLLDFTRISESKVIPVLQGVDLKYARTVPEAGLRDLREQYGLTGRYLLYAGQQKRYKNVGILIDVLKRLREDSTFDDVQLVLVGAKERDADLQAEITRQGLESAVVQPGYIRDEEQLIALYQGASAFTFPSRYEGFGLPPLEAMAAGVPVISSDRTSLPEVVGEAGLLVNPDDVEAWTRLTKRVLTDPDLRGNLVAAGHKRVHEFNWQRTADATVDVYRAALKEPVNAEPAKN
jgi:glycosyltransferase involved in cell wall biosynthesis